MAFHNNRAVEVDSAALNTTSDYLLGIEHVEFDYYRVRRMISRQSFFEIENDITVIY